VVEEITDRKGKERRDGGGNKTGEGGEADFLLTLDLIFFSLGS